MSEPTRFVVAIATLSALLLVHRCGRYLVVRWCGISVARFRVGVGPILLQRTWRSGTLFQLAAIPLGGSVKIVGMNVDGDTIPDDRHAFRNRPAWQQLVAILAGSTTDYLVAMVLAMLLYSCHGVDTVRWYGVGDTAPGCDAHDKLAPGDRITAVDHVPLYIDSAPTLTERVNAVAGAPVTLTIVRDGQLRDIRLQPCVGRNGDRAVWRLGIRYELQTATVQPVLIDAVRLAAMYPFATTLLVAHVLYINVVGGPPAEVVGPDRMVVGFSRPFAIDWLHLLPLVMLLGVGVGLVHLLPIPGLDGALLIALGYRLIAQRAKAG